MPTKINEARDYARRHPAAFRALASRTIGLPLTGTDEEYQALAEPVPFSGLRARGSRSGKPNL